MPVIRNRIARIRAGGPRQFSEMRNRLIIAADNFDSVEDVRSQLDRLDMEAESLETEPILIAEPRNQIADTLERFRQIEFDDINIRSAISQVQGDEDEEINITRSIVRSTNNLRDSISELPGVDGSDFVLTLADYGPENLRFSPGELDDVPLDNIQQEPRTLSELHDVLETREAWEIERGNQAIVAIFDTGFSRNLLDNGRVVATFSGPDVDTVYKPSEGHGTMTAGAAVANIDEAGPFNGSAPEAGIILVRVTDSNGQIRSDFISRAYDWLANLDTDRPIVANHSYGSPLCTGRPRGRFCNGPEVRLVKRVNADENVVSLYAAGNEAGHCGRRPSGLTNGITGVNSISEVLTVGALRFDRRDAQRYSSHGRGDCAPIADPKPNVSCALPMKTYYGVEGGWKIKDMSIGIGGSSGGTSHASPYTAGVVALMQSRSMKERGEPMQTPEIKQILHETSDLPRPTQINIFSGLVARSGYDARFGNGQVKPVKAVNEV